MAIVGAFSIGYISFPIGVPEFELSVCIIVLSLLIYFLIKVIVSELQAYKKLVTINNASILKIEELIDALNTTAKEMSSWIGLSGF